MKVWQIFLFLLSAVGFFACSDDHVQPTLNQLDGLYDVTWQIDGEVLHGSARFSGSKARIIAFGYPGSSILSRQEEADYTVIWNHAGPVLVNEVSGARLTYLITERDGDNLQFRMLDDIVVHFIRK